MNILYLTDKLNYADGVSTHLYYLLSELLEKSDLNISLMCSGGDASEKFEALGINVIVNENLNHNSRSIKGFLSALKSISDICRNNNINIIHSHNHYAANIASSSMKIRLSGKIKTVQTVHGIIPETGKLNHLNAGSYIAVNDHVYKYLCEKLSNDNNVSLIYNGMELKDNKSKIYNRRLRFVAAGRLDPGKRTDLFIKAVSKLSVSDRDKADFLIAGEGSDYEALKELDKNLNTKIEFTGLIKDLRKFFEDTDVFVMTSGSEGLPMTILEAASEKVLVISSAFDGIENIMEDNFDGFVFPVDSADTLSEKIKFVIDNPDSIKTFADNFYETASGKFNSDIMSDKHFNLYSGILTKGN